MVMNEGILMQRLEDLAKSSTRLKSRIPKPDMVEEYRQTMLEYGYVLPEQFKYELEDTQRRLQSFTRGQPAYTIILELLAEIDEMSRNRDPRSPEFVTYDVGTVLFVSILAGMCGYQSDEDVALFWLVHNLELQMIVPNMPSPRHVISAETVRTIRRIANEDVMFELFKKYFDSVKTIVREMVEQQTLDVSHFRHLIGGDGQELRASYRKGSYNRKKKGGQGVTLFDCDSNEVIGFTTVVKKNQESEAFTRILNSISVKDDAIFYADAINTKASLIDYLNIRKLDWIFTVKTNGGNKKLNQAIAVAFADAKNQKNMFCSERTKKMGGRIESFTYRILPADVLDEEHSNRYGKTRSVVMVEKKTQLIRIRKGEEEKVPKPSKTVRFYITSLKFNEDNCEQLIHSISVRWRYEVSHNTIDCVFLQDRENLCDPDHIEHTVGKNKILYNVLTYVRQRLSEQVFYARKRRTTSIKMLSYNRVTEILSNSFFSAVCYFIDYMMSDRN